MLNWIIENKEMLKLIYGLVIGLICIIIVLRTDRLYRLSLHQGIRYFRNAFLFYGIAFIVRYLLGALIAFNLISLFYQPAINLVFEYFLVIAGFSLIYSLLWKKIESQNETYSSSLFNKKIMVFYIMAIIIVLLDYMWGAFYLMFFSQITLFLFASVISFLNYKKGSSRHKFLKFYFIAMILSLIAWLLNSMTALFFNWDQGIMINIYIINSIIFLLFLYGVTKVTNK